MSDTQKAIEALAAFFKLRIFMAQAEPLEHKRAVEAEGYFQTLKAALSPPEGEIGEALEGLEAEGKWVFTPSRIQHPDTFVKTADNTLEVKPRRKKFFAYLQAVKKWVGVRSPEKMAADALEAIAQSDMDQSAEIARLRELVGQYQRASNLDIDALKKAIKKRDALHSALEEALRFMPVRMNDHLYRGWCGRAKAALSGKGEGIDEQREADYFQGVEAGLDAGEILWKGEGTGEYPVLEKMADTLRQKAEQEKRARVLSHENDFEGSDGGSLPQPDPCECGGSGEIPCPPCEGLGMDCYVIGTLSVCRKCKGKKTIPCPRGCKPKGDE